MTQLEEHLPLAAGVIVPAEFRQVGFSGLFRMDVAADIPWLWRHMVPCLLGNSGWMALRVNDDDSVTVVCKDAAAIWAVLTGAPGSRAVPILVAPGSDDWITSPSRYSVAHRLRRSVHGPPPCTRCGQRVRGRLAHAPRTMPRCRTCVKLLSPRRKATS